MEKEKEMEKEIRRLPNAELRNVDGQDGSKSRHIEGYALTFNSLSEDLGNFREQIAPEAIDGSILERSDIFALMDHNPERILARSRFGKGSLSLDIDERGLKYSFDAPYTDTGNELLEAIRRGDMTSSSFAFTVAEDEWQKQEDESYIRTIRKFDRLFDVSPVWEPAYQSTSVKCARFQELLEEERKANEERMREQEEKAQEEARKAKEIEDERDRQAQLEKEALDAYFEALNKDINNL